MALDDIVRAATDTQREMAASGEPPDDGGPARGGQPMPAAEMAGRVVEDLAPGPELAQWLASAQPADLNGFSLAGVASAARRLVSWAQACELSAVAEMAARSAAGDDSVPLGPEGGPARAPDDAADEVALALCMSRYSAAWWITTAITLAWRLPSTFQALRRGTIDLSRARLIVEATCALDDDAARAVQDMVLPGAGDQTLGQLRAALRRAVIAVDPKGAERRRQEAERRARIRLYADEEGTASLCGQNLPGAQSAAAMARISALAQAMKSAGINGGIELLRARAFLGLLLGTLPLIPPSGNPEDPGPADPGPEDPGPDNPGPDNPGPDNPGPDDLGPDDSDLDDATPRDPGSDGLTEPDRPREPDRPPEPGSAPDSGWPNLPLPGDVPAPGCAPNWPGPPAGARGSPGNRGSPHKEPRAGLLTVTVPWRTLAGLSGQPGNLCWLGPVTPSTARMLARTAAADPACELRVIVVGTAGQAIAITRLRRRARQSGGPAHGLISRFTLTVPIEILDGGTPPAGPDLESLGALGQVLGRAWQAARDAATCKAAERECAAPAGTCTHQLAGSSYRPSGRLHDFVVARDQTCRFPRCRQPAGRGDLDHTIAYEKGGATCSCNLGALCRRHHRLKQRRRWQLEQSAPGVLTWITPAGRRYTVTPDPHPA
jgi:hypothetical protein